MTLPLSYAHKARADLDDIYDFIAADNPVRAETYIEEIEAACEGLCEMPMLGVARPDLGPNLRILTLWRRIVIAYTVTPGRIDVLRVFSGGQDYEAIMGSD
ncbi:MAG: type II toxin-antitoxin system RelE/ParE family toxin [Methylocella sp.]